MWYDLQLIHNMILKASVIDQDCLQSIADNVPVAKITGPGRETAKGSIYMSFFPMNNFVKRHTQ